MTPFTTFVLTDAALLGLLIFAITWIFTTSSGALWVKITLALAFGALVAWSPLATRAILGFPQPRALTELPDRFQLFAQHSADDKSFDLWIASAGEETPLAVTIVPDTEMRKALRQAQQKLGRGQPVFMSRRKPKGKPGDGKESTDGEDGNADKSGNGGADGSPRTNFGDDQTKWELVVPGEKWKKDGE